MQSRIQTANEYWRRDFSAKSIISRPSEFHIIGHGLSFGIYDDRNSSPANRPILKVKQLIAALEEMGRDKWKNAKSVTLHSCSTGKGDNSIAQLLADLTGKNVIAPTDILTTNGEIRNEGNWRSFSPRQGNDLPTWVR